MLEFWGNLIFQVTINLDTNQEWARITNQKELIKAWQEKVLQLTDLSILDTEAWILSAHLLTLKSVANLGHSSLISLVCNSITWVVSLSLLLMAQWNQVLHIAWKNTRLPRLLKSLIQISNRVRNEKSLIWLILRCIFSVMLLNSSQIKHSNTKI